MSSSENPPPTKCHKQCHKPGVPRTSQKGNGPRGNHLRHAGRQEGGEGGIRTLGTIARTPVFETGPIDHSGTSPGGPTNTTLATGPGPNKPRPESAVSASPW